jgi:hypothetical protein
MVKMLMFFSARPLVSWACVSKAIHMRVAILALMLALTMTACDRAGKEIVQPRAQDAQAAIASLSKARIFFAHQSVGGNIVDGLRRLRPASESAALRIVDWQPAQDGEKDGASAFFAHARLGENGKPASKTAAFVSALESGLGNRVDIAMQKYCYVDIDTATDVASLFTSYKKAMERLQNEFPRMTLVHVTAPLMSVQSGPRAIIKKWIGRVPDYYEENIARDRFNELMRREYAGRAPLFDLAALETSRPGGIPEAVAFRNEKVYSLLPEYTYDGGHLNEAAQERIASEFVMFLARTLEQRQLAAR